MFKATSILAILITFFLSSCSNNKEQASEAVDNSDVIINDAETMAPVDEPVTEAQVEQVPADQSNNMNASAPATGSRLNPAHGEPGHRCDVNVGDPLPDDNGSGGVTVQQPTQQSAPTQTPTTIMNAPASGTTAEGMNPPHGEPGHDCSIPVGAPLKK